MADSSSIDNDLRAIDAINLEDVLAALANDPARMMAQWTDDFVLLQAGAPVLRGRNAIAAAFQSAESSIEILDYTLDIQGVRILGDHAFQWGTFQYITRPVLAASRCALMAS